MNRKSFTIPLAALALAAAVPLHAAESVTPAPVLDDAQYRQVQQIYTAAGEDLVRYYRALAIRSERLNQLSNLPDVNYEAIELALNDIGTVRKQIHLRLMQAREEATQLAGVDQREAFVRMLPTPVWRN